MQFRNWLEALTMQDTKARQQLSAHPAYQDSLFGMEIEFICTDKTLVRDIGQLIHSVGFTYHGGTQADEDAWGVGFDGNDSKHQLPVLEIRSGIMQLDELPMLQKFLEELVDYVRTTERTTPDGRTVGPLRAAGNTAIHLHVSNPALGVVHRDAFSRLAAAATGFDEDQVVADSKPYKRPFNRFAKLFSPKYNPVTVSSHDLIVDYFKREVFKRYYSGTPAGPLTGQELDNALGNKAPAAQPINAMKVVTQEELDAILNNEEMDRYVGINVQGKHNTVEYRHIPTTFLMEPNGVSKVMNYVQYFIQHLASRSNKSRFEFRSATGDRLVFTRLPNNNIQINFQETPEKVPMIGRPVDDLKSKPNPMQRLDQPFRAWYRSLNRQQQGAYKASKGLESTPRGLPPGLIRYT